MDNMKKIDNAWFICRDGWVFEEATQADIINHVFNGLSVASFQEYFNKAL